MCKWWTLKRGGGVDVCGECEEKIWGEYGVDLGI